jgi:hypothetical protein
MRRNNSNRVWSKFKGPVRLLLPLGQSDCGSHSWNKYLAPFDLRVEDVPDLIQLASDTDLVTDCNLVLERWAPLHAWRALWVLQAFDASPALLKMLAFSASIDHLSKKQQISDLRVIADQAGIEIPFIITSFGPTVLAAISTAIREHKNELTFFADVSLIVAEIGAKTQSVREHCIEILIEMLSLINVLLEIPSENKSPVKFTISCIVRALFDLRAEQKFNLIISLFKGGLLDPVICGLDEEDFEVSLGIRTERRTRRPLCVAEPENFRTV